jgi:hypothetical protein
MQLELPNPLSVNSCHRQCLKVHISCQFVTPAAHCLFNIDIVVMIVVALTCTAQIIYSDTPGVLLPRYELHVSSSDETSVYLIRQ